MWDCYLKIHMQVMLNPVQPQNGSVEPNHCDTVACRRLSCILALTKAPTLQTAVVCLQGRCVSKHKALSALLTAGRWRAAWRALKAIPPVEVVACWPGQLVFPHVLLVVLGQKCVEERVDAAVGKCQACGQIVDITPGFDGQGQWGVEQGQQLPDPERQEACPKEEHDGEDQVQYLWEQEISNENWYSAAKASSWI